MIDSNQDEAVKLEAGTTVDDVLDYFDACGCAVCKERAKPIRAMQAALALPPANLNAPDKQEALAGEGVEAYVFATCVECTSPAACASRRFCGVGSHRVAPQEEWRCVDCKRVFRCAEEPVRCPIGDCQGRTFAPVARSLPSTAGDDRNGVEGLREGIVELWHQAPAANGSLPHYLGMTEEQYAAWANPTALSRTPSSPQADEADVERLLEKAIDHVGKRWSGYAGCHAYACAVGREVAISALSLTRPAGGEEVGWTIEHGPVEGSVYLTASMGWSKHRASAIRFARKVDADDMIEANGWEDFRVAALTKPAALPKGEDLEQLILDARVAACGTRLTCREREVIRALCDAVEARAALAPPPQAQEGGR